MCVCLDITLLCQHDNLKIVANDWMKFFVLRLKL